MSHRGNVIACAAAAILALASGVGLPPLSNAEAAVSGTKHNLSTSGPGTRKASTEAEICIFCHAPHNTSPAAQLWNRRLPTAAYTPYSSSTLKSTPGQPNGASLLCLSCHDGTIALGDVLSRATPITMAGGAMSGDPLIGTNLADDHPISFVYNAALRTARGELADPATLTGAVKLDAGGRLQCTSCHDPHDSTNGKFLVMANTASALCSTCHQKNFWAQTDHRTSTRTWNGAGTNPWPHTTGTTVAANACENCHRPHTAGGAQSLVNYAAEETNCNTCHNGNVAVKNVQAEFAKASAHDVGNFTGIHTPAEASPPATAHVECVDCHNPHAARATTLPTKGGSTVPTLSGALEGVKGVNSSGTAVNPASFEYEICFRCHGATNPVTAQTARVIVTNNTIAEFANPANPSFHPVVATGKSTTVPSLISPWTTASRMTCTDCHNNNAGPYSTGTGTTPTGTGVNGAHGSINPMLLERAYQKADGSSSSAGTTESAAAYALCYKCHDRNTAGKGIIASGVTGSFRYHNLHVVGQRTPCNTCHDPHGVSATNGATTLSNSRLLNFRTGVVTAVSGQAIRWERVGTTGGRCYMLCHGKSHSPESY